jgi:DNA-directed RNA polymerase subunit H (RpoH/RPB5)
LKTEGLTIEERKARVLIKLRKYKLIKKEEHEEAISYLVKIPKDKQKTLIWCFLGGVTVGIVLMNGLYKLMKEKGLERVITITEGRYTHAVKKGAKGRNEEAEKNGVKIRPIELLPTTFPVFEIFEHTLVPKHEILTEEEKNQILAKYKLQPYQIPHIKSDDPVVKAIGAITGDVLRIIRKSQTAGKHISYRYVVE